MIKKGHKKIGLVCSDFDVHSSIQREAGYREALIESNISVDEKYIYRTDYKLESGKKAFDYFNSLEDEPTAIFAISDILDRNNK